MATITKKKYYQLDHIWETAIKMNGSVVLWRSPRENDKNLLIDLSSKISDSKTKIQASDMGFFITKSSSYHNVSLTYFFVSRYFEVSWNFSSSS